MNDLVALVDRLVRAAPGRPLWEATDQAADILGLSGQECFIRYLQAKGLA